MAGNGAADPYQLLLMRDFQGAVAAYDQLEGTAPERFSAVNRGLAFLNLGLLDRAMSDFLAAEEADRRNPSGRSDSQLKRIGLIHWLREEEDRALEVWNSVVSDIQTGHIQFSDLARGVGAGALLWFGSGGRPAVRARSESFLRERSGQEAWPGPMASFLVGGKDNEGFLSDARDANDRLAARQLCQAFFYAGMKAREANRREEALQLLREAHSQGPSALIEVEYYLSGYEASR